MNPIEKKFSYLEALIVVHNNMLVELVNNKLNVHILNNQSITNPTVNPQLEQNLLHFRGIVSKVLESIKILTKMIDDEMDAERKFKEKN